MQRSLGRTSLAKDRVHGEEEEKANAETVRALGENATEFLLVLFLWRWEAGFDGLEAFVHFRDQLFEFVEAL